MPHLSFPVAETAVHGAPAGDEKENPVRIMVGQTRNRGQFLFIQWVIKAFLIGEFPQVGHGLLVKGVFLFPDEVKVIGVDAHGILLREPFQVFGLAEFQEFGEIER